MSPSYKRLAYLFGLLTGAISFGVVLGMIRIVQQNLFPWDQVARCLIVTGALIVFCSWKLLWNGDK